MKDSGIAWIGEIPKEWEIERIKSIYSERTELSESGKETLLSVSEYYGVDKREKRIEDGDYVSRSESLIGYKKCFIGDIVSNIMLAWKGSLGMSLYEGIVSPAYRVYKPTNNIFSKYYHYLFRTNLYTTRFRCFSKGIIDSRLRLYSPYFYDIEAIIPPLTEQKAIAEFLDRKCGDIDELISLQEKMIEELKAYKQSIITETVTRGLNPDAPQKDSGIEWIGEIPEHWKNIRLRNLCVITTGDKDTVMKVDDGLYPFFVRSPKVERINEYSFDTEAILMAGDGVGAGKVFHYYNGKFGCHQRVYCLFNFSELIVPHFLLFFMTYKFQELFVGLSAKSTVDSVRLPMLKDFIITIPPLAEQQEIADYLDKKCEEIDSLISLKQQKIEELKEYKKSLIYEYVTGKKQVGTWRAMSAQHPNNKYHLHNNI